MAIKMRSLSADGKRTMTVEEFKRWIKRFDTDNDGRIGRAELATAVRATGAWFSGLKGSSGIRKADVNGDGLIEDSELENLVGFAEKHLNIRVLRV